MPREYDKEIQKQIMERQQKVELRKEERIKERNKILMIGGAGLLALLLIILIIAKIAGGSSSNKEVVTTKANPKVAETTTVAPTTQVETTPAVVTMKTTDTVNFRKEASTTAEIITQVPAGDVVTVINNDGTWCQVTYNDQQGYISAEFLKADDSTEESTSTESTSEAE